MMKTSDQQSFDRDRYLECILISFQGSASLHLNVTGACGSGPKQVLFNDLHNEIQPPELADNCKSILYQSGGSVNQNP